MPVRVYQYPKCGTCRKALQWLGKNDIAYEAVDVVLDPPSAKALKDMHQRSGVPLVKFFNTSGESYRKGNFKERLRTLTDAQMFAALAADGKLIKRPLVDDGKAVLVGFDAEAYAARFKASKP